ncbi:NADPH-quinone reductase [Paenibacillus wynnii]|uniref:NADPH-quinone reductase n=1 Tax=Paenibacillus wynnii TaxID=268407 RepID=A0A098MCB3_9BACL|nr:NAD(P)H-dependent oxidoreductase [Paenibacillus wynnii]KGE20190.1 NADPH-quinone reductase [Paenibacillus wynnii]
MKNNIAVIIGHPNRKSYCNALAVAYAKGAVGTGADVRVIDLGDISFEPNLKHGYQQRTELEKDLITAQETIRWADHLVFVYPNWWGTMPAILKGFIDRVFLPGYSFNTKPNSYSIEKLLKGKTARLIVTMDSPPWYYRLVLKRAGHLIMKRAILQFCGVKPVWITEIGMVKTSPKDVREKWLKKIEALGVKRA